MAEQPIADAHRAQFARWQHTREWLAAERARLEAELRYVAGHLARMDAEMTALLQRAYGLDAAHVPVTLDSERGVLVTPADEPPMPADDPPATAVEASLAPTPDPKP